MELNTLSDFYTIHRIVAITLILASFFLSGWIAYKVFIFIDKIVDPDRNFDGLIKFIVRLVEVILSVFLFFVLLTLIDMNQSKIMPKGCAPIKQQASIYNYYNMEVFGKCEYEDGSMYILDQYEDYESCKLDVTKGDEEIEFILSHTYDQMIEWFPSSCGRFDDNIYPF
tara:strand:+ start:4236 stop:4742 length:507 start_codon:yes stop_codon:yes gene_type:complete